MKVKFRSTAAIVVALTALAVAGLFVPSAAAAAGDHFVFVTQPQDSLDAPATIRGEILNQSSSAFVQVALLDANDDPVTNSNTKVSFVLASEPGDATSGSLSVTPQSLVDGVATFGEGTLSIGAANEPFFTNYRLVPVSTRGPKITGDPSAGFDIFQDGESCADECNANLPHGTGSGETYSAPIVGTLGASQISDSNLSTFACAGQTEIFPDVVFVHETTEGSNTVFESVKLVSHVTRQEMKKAANNGQAHIKWCVGLKDPEDWTPSGGSFVPQDTNGNAPGGLLYVGFAPPCPQANPSDFAPCIASQNGDGNGGSITTGYLPGGDPPRRT